MLVMWGVEEEAVKGDIEGQHSPSVSLIPGPRRVCLLVASCCAGSIHLGVSAQLSALASCL